jgi:C4-dicarboxylate-specific signal transduction histidine kinase
MAFLFQELHFATQNLLNLFKGCFVTIEGSCKILVKNFERTLSNATTKIRLCFARLMTERLATSQYMSQLSQNSHELSRSNSQLSQALMTLKKTQLQLIQTEKMSSLGQLVAGIAHEINNPVSFIYGNLHYIN